MYMIYNYTHYTNINKDKELFFRASNNMKVIIVISTVFYTLFLYIVNTTQRCTLHCVSNYCRLILCSSYIYMHTLTVHLRYAVIQSSCRCPMQRRQVVLVFVTKLCIEMIELLQFHIFLFV